MFLKDLIDDELSKLVRDDMVFDRYFDFSTESVARTRRGGDQGTRYCVLGNTPLPRPCNWTTFLKSAENKRELNEFLAKRLFETVQVGAKKIFIATCNENVLVVPNGGVNVGFLQPCNQDEADTRICYMQFMHLLIAAQE